jgi:hypothetical protein
VRTVEEVIATPARLYVRHTLPLEQAKTALASRNSPAAGARARARLRRTAPAQTQTSTLLPRPGATLLLHPLSAPLTAPLSPPGSPPVVVDDNFNPMGLVYLEDIEAEIEEDLVKQELLNQVRPWLGRLAVVFGGAAGPRRLRPTSNARAAAPAPPPHADWLPPPTPRPQEDSNFNRGPF